MRVLLLFIMLILPVSSYAWISADYDCGKGSTAFITHPNKTGDFLYINGVGTTITTDIAVAFPCYSSITVGCADGDYRVSIVSSGLTSQLSTYAQIASFFVGVCAAMAFVISSRGDS